MEHKDLQVELFGVVEVNELEERREFGYYSYLWELIYDSWYD